MIQSQNLEQGAQAGDLQLALILVVEHLLRD
jgi:hypothetical protein